MIDDNQYTFRRSKSQFVLCFDEELDSKLKHDCVGQRN